MRRSTLLWLLALWGNAAWSDGIIIPEPPFPSLAVKYHRVDVAIDDQAARTAIDQVFLNRAGWDIEGTYLFPLPDGASFSAFSMFVDGQPLAAEVLPADEARRIYEEIVRRRIDPALLEYAGQGAYRARIFPIPAQGEKRVELAYDEVLTRDAGVVRYLYPLNTEKFSAEPLEDVSVSVTIRSTEPIKAVYSPSHPIAVERAGEHEAHVVYADEQVTPRDDFLLYYTVAEGDVGVNLLSYRPDEGEDAYYLMLAAPQVEPDSGAVIPKRVVIALDRSGSMAGEKIEQARGALSFVVQSLEETDLVGLVEYGTTVEAFADTAVPVSAQNRTALLAYIDGLGASGGTDIHGALMRSLAMVRGDGRAEMIVFLTDGKPTVGVTDVERILADVDSASTAGARIFVFGVGYDVNTHLLDRLSGDNGGTSAYVQPGEDLELAVSSFYAKVTSPVLEDLALQIPGASTRDAYPSQLPDLFRGAQIVQLGRLTGQGELTVRLAGTVRGEPTTFERQVAVPGSGPESLPRLWATRKVGYLLDQIRLHGQEAELVDEIVALSKRFGIITPYTSFLIVEDEPPAPIVDDRFRAESGADAVAASQSVRGYAEADNAAQARSEQVRYAGDKTFFLRDGVWRDSQFDDSRPALQYAFGSQAYFDLAAGRPELGRYLALGPAVDFTREGQSYRIRDVATPVDGETSARPRDLRLEQSYPNPFNRMAEIRYTVSAVGAVELSIYDLTGQRVAVLVRRWHEAGEHATRWDGRDDGGGDAATGVYLCLLRAGDETRLRKLLLMK